MKVAPFRALTLFNSFHKSSLWTEVEMKVAPFRALTLFVHSISFVSFPSVEMKVAPFRALTLFNSVFEIYLSNGGNEGRPFQGIDT